MTPSLPSKPLGQKAYGSIAHLPGSRLGPGDHHCHEGQARIATERPRDRHDHVVVQEKLDGSCMAVAKIDGQIVALNRAGYPAVSSPYAQHHLFAAWVNSNKRRFDDLLVEGERAVGEWLALAHGTRYDLTVREPFVVFDLMIDGTRMTAFDVELRCASVEISTPMVIHNGPPLSIDDALRALGPHGFYGALDHIEGAVWRVERNGKIDFLAKYVRPDKVDGAYFIERTGYDVWNWLPGEEKAAA
jgi:RNA ligase